MIEKNDEYYAPTPDDQGRLVRIGAEAVMLNGILHIPEEARGLVIFGHGIESETEHPHQSVLTLARAFHQHGLATLVVDLFSSDEIALDERTSFFRQNIDIMQQRLVGTAEWFLENPSTENLSVGYFGLNEVGAAALAAAVERPDVVAAVVAAGSGITLARDYVPRVLAPTLLLAAEGDHAAVQANQELGNVLQARKSIEVIAGEDSLFASEHGFAEAVRLIGGWFTQWLIPIF